jgi:hypothetical protein
MHDDVRGAKAPPTHMLTVMAKRLSNGLRIGFFRREVKKNSKPAV